MFNYNVISKPNFKYTKKTIDILIKIIYKITKRTQNGIINIVFLDDDSIQKLNKEYRNIDKTTDVLSFHYFENFDYVKDVDLAGEIILSENKIKEQGIEYGLGEEKEFYKLIIHSTLHILGYDHELDNDYKIMQDIENKVWKEVFEK